VTVTDIRSRQAYGAPALDRDTQLLSGLLEHTIADQGGEALRSAVVRLHQASAQARAGDPGADEQAAALAAEILDGDSLDVIRACSMELHLANIAETRERVRRRRGYEHAGGPPQRNAWPTGRPRPPPARSTTCIWTSRSPPTRPRPRGGR
jgi:phosphoenolpyruvate carboxylase